MKHVAVGVWWVCGIAVLVCVPAVAAQEQAVPATLYFQMFDTLEPFLITREPPTYFPGIVRGTDMPGSWLTNGTAGMTGIFAQGPIERDPYVGEVGAVHQARLGRNLVLASDGNAHLYVQIHPPTHTVNHLAAYPLTTFQIQVQAGQENAGGALLMSGTTTVHLVDLAGMSSVLGGQVAPDGRPILVPDIHGVIHVPVPVQSRAKTWDERDGFHVRLAWWQGDETVPGSDRVATNHFRYISDALHVPRMEFEVESSLAGHVVVTPLCGRVVVSLGVDSLWGPNGVDLASLRINIRGPTAFGLQSNQTMGPNSWGQDRSELWYHTVWQSEAVADGVYRVEATFQDVERVEVVEVETWFVVAGGRWTALDGGEAKFVSLECEKAREAPGVGPWWLVVLALMANRRS